MGEDANGNFHGRDGQYISVGDHIKAILEEKDKVYDAERRSDAVALALQAREYERRLEDLNNSFDRSAKDREDFITKTTYVGDTKANAAEVKALAVKLDDALRAAATAVDLKFEAQAREIEALRSFKDKAAWLYPALTIFGGVAGATITKVLVG